LALKAAPHRVALFCLLQVVAMPHPIRLVQAVLVLHLLVCVGRLLHLVVQAVLEKQAPIVVVAVVVLVHITAQVVLVAQIHKVLVLVTVVVA
jgi:hypothetical protein